MRNAETKQNDSPPFLECWGQQERLQLAGKLQFPRTKAGQPEPIGRCGQLIKNGWVG